MDACALAPALGRNLLLSLAEAGAFQPRWSSLILDEAERAIIRILAHEPQAPAAARRARLAMARAFEEANIGAVAPFEAVEALPDPNDAHVIAAAIQTRAGFIVTDNLGDFPAPLLEPFGVKAIGVDACLDMLIAQDPDVATAAVARMRARFRSPSLTAEALLELMRIRGLHRSADLLNLYKIKL